MADWAFKEKFRLGDTRGNPVDIWVGVVTVKGRTTVGIQLHPDPHDRPHFTLDSDQMTASRELWARLHLELHSIETRRQRGEQ